MRKVEMARINNMKTLHLPTYNIYIYTHYRAIKYTFIAGLCNWVLSKQRNRTVLNVDTQMWAFPGRLPSSNQA